MLRHEWVKVKCASRHNNALKQSKSKNKNKNKNKILLFTETVVDAGTPPTDRTMPAIRMKAQSVPCSLNYTKTQCTLRFHMLHHKAMKGPSGAHTVNVNMLERNNVETAQKRSFVPTLLWSNIFTFTVTSE